MSKEFEIYYSPNQLASSSHLKQNQQNNLSYLLIGHQEKKIELNHLFSYDLGQVILSKGELSLLSSPYLVHRCLTTAFR